MLVLIQLSINMVAGNQQKHLCYKSVNVALEERLEIIKKILFLIHELFRSPNSLN